MVALLGRQKTAKSAGRFQICKVELVQQVVESVVESTHLVENELPSPTNRNDSQSRSWQQVSSFYLRLSSWEILIYCYTAYELETETHFFVDFFSVKYFRAVYFVSLETLNLYLVSLGIWTLLFLKSHFDLGCLFLHHFFHGHRFFLRRDVFRWS